MKTFDFFCLSGCRIKFIFVSLIICSVGSALADPPPAEAFNHPSDLVLTLSDKWLETNTSSNHESRNPNRNLITEKSKPKPANIGCGMDANPIATTSTSLTSQLVGKCNFDYHY